MAANKRKVFLLISNPILNSRRRFFTLYYDIENPFSRGVSLVLTNFCLVPQTRVYMQEDLAVIRSDTKNRPWLVVIDSKGTAFIFEYYWSKLFRPNTWKYECNFAGSIAFTVIPMGPKDHFPPASVQNRSQSSSINLKLFSWWATGTRTPSNPRTKTGENSWSICSECDTIYWISRVVLPQWQPSVARSN